MHNSYHCWWPKYWLSTLVLYQTDNIFITIAFLFFLCLSMLTLMMFGGHIIDQPPTHLCMWIKKSLDIIPVTLSAVPKNLHILVKQAVHIFFLNKLSATQSEDIFSVNILPTSAIQPYLTKCQILDSVMPSDAICYHRTWSTLVQIMAWWC